MYASHRCSCGCCLNSKRPAARQVPKHKDIDKVKKMVRQAVYSIADGKLAVSGNAYPNWITAEDLANHLDADLAVVKHALHMLNLEGLVRQPTHGIPHDSNRDPWRMCKGGFSAWKANTYVVIPKADRKRRRQEIIEGKASY